MAVEIEHVSGELLFRLDGDETIRFSATSLKEPWLPTNDQLNKKIAGVQLSYDICGEQAFGADGLRSAFGAEDRGIITKIPDGFEVKKEQIPGMTVLCPASFAELRTMLHQAICDCSGPVAVRYPRGGEGDYQDDRTADGAVSVLRDGCDCTIVTYGVLVNQAMSAAEMLQSRGITAQVVKMNRMAPLDPEAVCGCLGNKGCMLVLEDCLANGCIGQQLISVLSQNGVAPDKLILKNMGSFVPDHGTADQLYQRYHLDAPSVAAAIEEALA